ncbi:MAG: discoidin domain-containing protein [Nitrospirae bacterium]|nr:discoidin domain-containing protein [Nitrospirota bacterium]
MFKGRKNVVIVLIVIVLILSHASINDAMKKSSDEFSLKASKSTTEHPPAYVFDGVTDGDGFWEPTGAYPFWIEVIYGSSKIIKKYSLCSGSDAEERMPVSWQLHGSDDGLTWEILDIRANVKSWKKRQIRDYTVLKPKAFKHYRLRFTEGGNPTVMRIYEINLYDDDGTNSMKGGFMELPDGSIGWPNVRMTNRVGGGGLSDLKGVGKRAQPGGTIAIQPRGDYMRGAIDMLPTAGKLPQADALAEVTLHRIVPSKSGFEMVRYAALATDTVPFGIIVESGGAGKARPFVFWTLREETADFSKMLFSEAFRITEDGLVQVGRKRGSGTADKILKDDPALVDSKPVDALFLEKQDPGKQGVYNSDYLKIVAKSRDSRKVHRYEWRLNVQINDKNNDAALVISSSKDGSSYNDKLIVRHDGNVELSDPEAGIVMSSPGGKRFKITVDDAGTLKTSPIK